MALTRPHIFLIVFPPAECHAAFRSGDMAATAAIADRRFFSMCLLESRLPLCVLDPCSLALMTVRASGLLSSR